MSTNISSLFREEAIRNHVGRLEGGVNIVTPIAWHLVGCLLLFGLLSGIAFLSFSSYSRIETVSGVVALDKGIAAVMPTRAGVVQSIEVAEGAHVRAGDVLAIIRAEENRTRGGLASDRILRSLDEQDAHLASQGDLLLKAALADQERLKAQITGARAALSALDAQISDEKDLVAAAERDYHNAESVAARGYISRRDMDQRWALVLSRRQQLAQLQQGLSDKHSEIAQAERAIAQTGLSAQAQAAYSQSSRQSVAQQVAQTDMSRGYGVTSPLDGTVTGLVARPGQRATSDQQLMMVVPVHAKPRVELYVPTSSAGFLAVGQEVRLSVDAFPYQTYGTVKAKIASISQAAVIRQSVNGGISAYFVTTTIEEPWIMAFGKRRELRPGMTVSARIVTEKRSLVEWLFEPLFAVRNR